MQLDWPDEPQPSAEHTHQSLDKFFKDFKLCSLLKKENLQEYISVQVELNQEREEGLILDDKK